MSGTFSVGGLMTGLDTNTLIQQLMTLERQPITRIQRRIGALEAQQTALSSLRTQLLTLRGRVQDFRFDTIFDQYQSTSSDEAVLTSEVSGQNPVVGSYDIEVLQLASATVASGSDVLGSPIDPNVALDSSGINGSIVAGDFTINGVTFSVDPATDDLNSILATITASDAGVTATYDAGTDKVVFANKTAGDTSIINFGGTDDDSNFLSVLNVTGANQATNGSGSTEVTSTRNLGAIDPSAILNTLNLRNGAIQSGSFRVNGVTIAVDVTTDSLSDVLGRISNSDAGVTASYDTTTDTIRVVSETLGSRTISFQDGTSDFLSKTNLTTATQAAGNDAQFIVNGGATLTRNTNEVSDAIGGVTLNLLSVGTSAVTVSGDDDSVVEDVQEFIDEFNTAIADLRSLSSASGSLENDGSLRIIETFLRTTVFEQVSGISGDFKSLVDIGISTGDSFDAESVSQLTLDEDAFREALRDDRANVEALFANDGETGVADRIFDYLDEITGLSGFLNQRAKSNGIIDQQIESLNDQIDRVEERVTQKENRLRAQFARMEQLSAAYQSQGSMLSGMMSGYGLLLG
ncbi:MAG: flagellar filament capping protein FliD [Candidatus Hydrogenedentes bacterium]|nr:flagellar filament capping protein FliD [Candidatus Hydrogenedentota bacterium]